ncbi:MAG: DUF5456 family protein [Rikenellaceae bacterium]|nr:DUF5456 family protein [Rikenellaceae bacterium]
MNKTYSISEFIELLGLDVWPGGMVEGLDYVSAPTPSQGEQESAGLTGLWLGSGLMIERERPNEATDTEIIFSKYDPYRSVYDFLSVRTQTSKGQVKAIVRELMEKESLSHRRGRKTFTDSPFKQQAGYEANHYSMYGGAVSKPKTRRGR